ncbi:MAG: cellulase family glycosylhydrolase [Acidobacteriia bacterium]|nr:cellulase family glycosylhydrolase [Terriglobia bacterium]
MKRYNHNEPGTDGIAVVRTSVYKGKAQPPSFDPSRRQALKSLAGAVAAMTLPLIPGGTAAQAAAHGGNTPESKLDGNPRWYGFNLLEYFSTDPDWMKYFPYKDDGLFKEDDFRWIRDWGFTWVRLPMDYRFWTDSHDLKKIDEKKVEPIDRAVRLGEKYGIHVNISLHRAPGFCVLDGLDPVVTGIHVTPEKTSFYNDSPTLDAFVHQWAFFARRYKGSSNKQVSFNLVNEPFWPVTQAERTQLRESMKGQPKEAIDRAIEARGAKEYARVARAAIEGIRAIDPQRLIVSDGSSGGVTLVPELFGTGVLQSPHDYFPPELTHFQCEWARGWATRTEPPTWPLKDSKGKVIADRKAIADFLRPWRGMAQHHIPIHFGEMGAYKHTPPDVVLAWFDDTLDLMGELHSGWALWNFRGPFGVLDTERAGTKFEDWHGHQLDRALLKLLQSKMA